MINWLFISKNHRDAMSYDFAFGHPIVYEEPKVPELEKRIEELRVELKHFKKLFKVQCKKNHYLEPFEEKAKTLDAMFDDYHTENKTLKAKINELQAENEQLKAQLNA